MFHTNNMSLTEEEKLKYMGDLRMKSRMKFLDKREGEVMEKERAILKDEK